MKNRQTCLYLTDEDIALKKEIEEKLGGAKLTNSIIYRRGLQNFKELVYGNILSIGIDTRTS